MLYNEVLHGLYRSHNILAISVIRYRRFIGAGHVAKMGEGMSALQILTGKPPGKRPLGRPRHSWEDNIGNFLYS